MSRCEVLQRERLDLMGAEPSHLGELQCQIFWQVQEVASRNMSPMTAQPAQLCDAGGRATQPVGQAQEEAGQGLLR